MSIPSGMLVEKYKEKKDNGSRISYFICRRVSVFSIPTLLMFLISLFSDGCGMAMLQVAINPLLRVAGGEENFALIRYLRSLYLVALICSANVFNIPGYKSCRTSRSGEYC